MDSKWFKHFFFPLRLSSEKYLVYEHQVEWSKIVGFL